MAARTDPPTNPPTATKQAHDNSEQEPKQSLESINGNSDEKHSAHRIVTICLRALRVPEANGQLATDTG